MSVCSCGCVGCAGVCVLAVYVNLCVACVYALVREGAHVCVCMCVVVLRVRVCWRASGLRVFVSWCVCACWCECVHVLCTDAIVRVNMMVECMCDLVNV